MGHFIDKVNEPKIIKQMIDLFNQSQEPHSLSNVLLIKDNNTSTPL